MPGFTGIFLRYYFGALVLLAMLLAGLGVLLEQLFWQPDAASSIASSTSAPK